MSRRRLLGWEPEERHEHYDAEGNLTGYTVVTRDPEFDDDELGLQLAYLHYQRGICACGIHESLASDEGIYWTFENRVCPLCKASAQQGRAQAAEDKRIEDQMGDVPPMTPRPADGRRVYVRQLGPEEVEERRAVSRAPSTRSPQPSPPEQ